MDRQTPEFERTWATIAPQFEGGQPDPSQSLRGAETLAADPGGPLDVGGLPLLSVATDGELTTQRLLGEGGMGKVELAIQRSLRREVAIKSSFGDATGAKAQALLQEALTTGLLEHPNIVPVHQLGRGADDQPLLVMKRVEGVSWDALIRDPAHPHWKTLGDDRLREHVAILISVCNAVEFAHARGIVHRDIKPANVMVGAFGEVYLLDWGLAMPLDPRPTSSSMVGTPGQMAPEMLEGTAEVTERTDVYLLGAALHSALTGKPRHVGSSVMNVCFQAHLSEPAVYSADVPTELGRLCNQATHADPTQRPPTAAAFRRELERYLEHRSSIALAEEANLALASLRTLLTEATPDAARLAALLAECRFGFAQALRGWPENDAARAGLQASLTLVIEHALREGNQGVAESLLAELPQPAPDLAARVATLQAAQRARNARLDALETAEDWTQSAGARLAFFVGMLAVGVALWLWANEGHIRAPFTLTPLKLATSGAFVLLALSGMVFFGRRQLLTNEVNTRLVLGALLTGAAIITHRFANCIPAPPTAALISGEIIVCGYGAALGGLLLAPWLWLQVPIWLTGAFAARLVPGYAGLCFAISALLALGVGAWKLHQQAKRAKLTP